jgi:predicted RNase H-like HicB family nuclease
MPDYHYTAVFEPAEEDGYVVTVPALPGLVTERRHTRRSSRDGIKDAIRGYLESLMRPKKDLGQLHASAKPVFVILARDCRAKNPVSELLRSAMRY